MTEVARIGERIQGLQLEALGKVAFSAAVLNTLNAAVITIVFWGHASRNGLAIWLCANALYSAVLLADGRNLFVFRILSWRWRMRLIIARSVVLGALWGFAPWLLLPQATNGSHLAIGIIVAGMVTGGVSRLAPAPGAAVAFTWTLAALACGAFFRFEPKVAAFTSILMVSYAAFLTQHIRAYGVNLLETWQQKLVLEQTRDTVALLLNEFQDGASDWLWECDAHGRLINVSDRFAEVAAGKAGTLAGRTLADLLDRDDPDDESIAGWILRNDAFRDLEVKVSIDGEDRHWLLSGRPILDDAGNRHGFRGVGSDMTARRDAEARADYLADFDTVTGLANARRFRSDVAAALSELGADEGVAVLRVDLLQFEALSAAIGPAKADVARRLAAQRLRSVVSVQHPVGRLGAGALSVQLTGADPRSAATRMAKAIEQAFRAPLPAPDGPLSVEVSIGIALSSDAADADVLIRNAGLAFDAGPGGARDGYAFFEPGMDAVARRRHALTQALRHAVARGELSVHYQPIVNLETSSIECCEALVRWSNAQFGPVSPVEFIPLAEETGLIVPIGEWVLRQATVAAAQWPRTVRVAVNLSPAQFRGHKLLATITSALAQSGLAPDRLELEITESSFLEADEHIIQTLRQIKALGARVALDDFGTGYSSLSYLRNLPLNKIKIDKSFVDAMLLDAVGTSIVRVITELAAALGFTTTAEGVESEAQLEALRQLGCDTVQGYFISRPLPEDAVGPFLQGAGAVYS